MRTLSFVVALLAAPQLVSPVAAQSALDEAKAQYEAAAYEDALSTLTRAGDGAPANRVQVEQYRALCLIALGKMPDAERAVVALVAEDPMYIPSANVASPRVLSLVSDIRRKELPAVARRLFDTGRTAFQQKEFTRAKSNFDLLLKLLDDPAMEGRPEREDLRSLAQGFVTLAASSTTARPAAPEPAAQAPPPMSQAPATVLRGSVQPAIAVQETMPIWMPPNQLVAQNEYTGSLKVRIGADGQVKGVSIEKPSHPAYDARLLQAARMWTYKPAMQNGVAVESEKIIAIRLRPR